MAACLKVFVVTYPTANCWKLVWKIYRVSKPCICYCACCFGGLIHIICVISMCCDMHSRHDVVSQHHQFHLVHTLAPSLSCYVFMNSWM